MAVCVRNWIGLVTRLVKMPYNWLPNQLAITTLGWLPSWRRCDV